MEEGGPEERAERRRRGRNAESGESGKSGKDERIESNWYERNGKEKKRNEMKQGDQLDFGR